MKVAITSTRDKTGGGALKYTFRLHNIKNDRHFNNYVNGYISFYYRVKRKLNCF
jgi:hypothetical protein